MSVNKVFLLGNVGTDPEVRYVAPDKPIARFRLATTERAHTTASGATIPETTERHTIVMTGRNAQVAERYIRKGGQLFIEGHLRTRTWEDRNQIKHKETEIYAESFELLARPRTDQTSPNQ